MSITLVYPQTKASIATLTLDASLSETHTTSIEVTEHPVEQGVNIVDHRRRKPDTLSIEGLVTNDPTPHPGDPAVVVDFIPASNAHQGARGIELVFHAVSKYDGTRTINAYQTLLHLADSATLLTVVTALRTYENMTLTDLNVPRDAQSGQALRFTAVLKEVKVVQNLTTEVNAKTSRSTGQRDLQHKVAPPADAATASKGESLIHKGGKLDPIGAVKKKLSGLGIPGFGG